MAEDNYSRTEPPSERRLAQARAEGHVPRSTALTFLLVLGAVLLVLVVWGANLLQRMQEVLADHFRGVARSSPDSALVLLQQTGLEILPFLIVLFLTALAAPMLLSGWVFAPRAARFDGRRLNPLPRLTRLFSAEGMFDLAKAALAWLMLALLLGWFLQARADDFARLAALPLNQAIDLAWGMLQQGVLLLLAAVVLLAILDAPWQWWRYLRGLAMSQAELQAEAQETQVRPELRARLLGRWNERQRGRPE